MEQINLLNPFENLLADVYPLPGYAANRIVWVYGLGYFLVPADVEIEYAEDCGRELSSVVVDQLIADQHLKLRNGPSRMRLVYTITESGREIVRQKACFVEAR